MRARERRLAFVLIAPLLNVPDSKAPEDGPLVVLDGIPDRHVVLERGAISGLLHGGLVDGQSLLRL